MDAVIVAGQSLLERGPDAFLEPLALAHVREEIDDRAPALNRFVPRSSKTCGIDLKSAIACWASTLGVCFTLYEPSGSFSVASVIKLRLAVGASCRKSPRWMTMGTRPKAWWGRA